MGNEFGHPEWIDFPREGNGWSYKYARRQWSLAENRDLKYHYLDDFDREAVKLVKENLLLNEGCEQVKIDDYDNILAFKRKEFIFIFNFHPGNSYTGYGLPVDQGKYRCVLSSDEGRFGGFDLVDLSVEYRTVVEKTFGLKQRVDLYIPARTALVLRKLPVPRLR